MSLVVKIGADTRSYEKEMKKLTKDIQSVSDKLGSVGQSLTTNLTVPIGIAGAAIVTLGAEFEASMSKLGAVTGATGNELKSLQDKAMEMGSNTKYSATEAADAMTELAKAGMNSNQTMAAIPGVLSMAATENMELATAAEITSAILNGFSLEAEQAGMVADVLAMNSNMSATGVEAIGAAMAPVAGFASQLGMKFTDVNAVLGIMANNGVDGAVAGQKLMAILRSLVAPSSMASKELDRLGISVFDANGKMKQLPEIIDIISNATKDLGDQEKLAALKTIFGTEAMAGLLPLLKEGGAAVQEYSDQLQNSSGYADETAKAINNNLKGAFDELSSALETAAIGFYQHIGPALTDLVKWITGLIQKFAQMSPATQKAIIVLAGIAAAVGPVLMVVSKLILGVGKLKAAFTMAKGATTAFGAASALAGGPIGLIALAIAGVIAVVAALIIYWDDIKEATINTWNAIKDFFSGLFDSVSSMFSETWNGIKETTVGIWNGIKDFFSEWGLTILTVLGGPIAWIIALIVKNWDAIKSFTTEAWTSIKDFFVGIWQSMVDFFTPIVNSIKEIITGVWNGISTVTSAIWNYIVQYVQAIWTAILYFATPIFQAISDFITTVWNGIKNTATTIWNAIKAFLTSIWNGIKSVATTVWTAISSFFTNTWNSIKSVATTVWNAIKSFLSTVWNGIKGTATTIWNGIVSAIKGPVTGVKNWLSSTFNAISSYISNVWNGIKSTATSVWNGIKSGVVNVVNGMVSTITSAFNGLKSSIVGVWNGIKSGIKSVINGIISIINKFISGFNTPAKLLNKIPGVDAPIIPSIPMLATGGSIFGNGQAIVGEAGPELLSKSGSSVKVTPLSSQEKASGIGGALNTTGGTTTLTVPLIINGSEFARAVVDDLDAQLYNKQRKKSKGRGIYR